MGGGHFAKEGSSAKFELVSGLTLASQRSFLRKTINWTFVIIQSDKTTEGVHRICRHRQILVLSPTRVWCSATAKL